MSAPARTTAARPAPRGKSPAGKARMAPAARVAVQYAVARKGLPSPATVRRLAALAAERAFEAGVRFVGTREGRTLNALYRGKEYATNVLTFVYDEGGRLTGDVVLCVPVLRREAKSQGKALAAHCAHLLLHGFLHLQGHDHVREREAARMERREAELLASLGYPDPYADERRFRSRH